MTPNDIHRILEKLEKLKSECDRLQRECDIQKSALKKSHDELELEVARRTAEIRRLQERLQAENTYLREELAGAHAYGEIIGESPSLKGIMARIDLVAPTGASVLILGESGTGKELIAREIHKHSQCADRPLIKVNCATIPRELYESEFFGHIKGSFTGAISDRLGRFEAADGGTLFLDEVGEIPPGLQGKLLRVLQEGEFERVGEGRTRKVDVRIIAATNKNLAEEVTNGRFREDFYYRLNVFPIEVPPLRDHKEDIPLLAVHFVKAFSRRLNRPAPPLTEANLMDLDAHDWPGNVRELQNIIERALILSPEGRLRFDLPRINADGPPSLASPNADPARSGESILTDAAVKALQKQNMLAALIQSDWKIYGRDGAAHRLGIKPTTLIERMRRLGIKRPG
jgi:transcriptional regulator with GAF, ATPase, and Fis domain